MAKSTLNTGHALYGNLIFALGEISGGSAVELVSASAIGTLASGTTTTSDGTHGTLYVSDASGTTGINFGDLAILDGLTAASIFCMELMNAGTLTSANCALFNKGTGTTQFYAGWQSSENVSIDIDTADGAYSAVITDGLHSTAGEDPTVLHSVGFTYGSGGLITRVNATKSAATAATGAFIDDANSIVIHGNTTESGLTRTLYHFFIFDKELNDTEWNDLQSNPNLIYAAAAGGAVPVFQHHYLRH